MMTRAEVVAAAEAKLPLPQHKNTSYGIHVIHIKVGESRDKVQVETVAFYLDTFGCSDGHCDVTWAEWRLLEERTQKARQPCPICSKRVMT
jgi:hypothetical protein